MKRHPPNIIWPTMRTTKLFAVWLLRAWPVLALFPLVACHLLALRMFPVETNLINKLTGTCMQIVGGLLVLSAIDGNLGLFRKKTLVDVVVAWFRDMPLFLRSVSIELTGVSAGVTTSDVKGTTERSYSTVDERLAELERQVKELYSALSAQRSALLSRIDEVKVELSKGLAASQAAVQELSERIEASTVGGFKQQAFGVLLAIYGAIVSMFA